MSQGPPRHDQLDNVRSLYREQFRRHGDSPAGVFWPKGRQELRWQALTAAVDVPAFDLLDYGCGLAHMRDWLTRRHPRARYTGVDILEEYIEHARQEAPEASVQLVRGPTDVVGEFDFTVLSGVFNIRYVDDEQEHEAIVFDVLEQLFTRTRQALSVNFQTPFADFVQEASHHQNVGRLLDFVVGRLSRRFTVDHATLPYEYTLTVWRDDRVCRPESVFEAGV